MIIDMRLRPPMPAWTRTSAFDTAMFYPHKVHGFEGAPSAKEKSLDLLFQEMDEAGITTGVIMGRRSSGGLSNVSNEDVKQFLDQYPNRFVGFVGVDLADIPGSVQDIQTYGKLKLFKGVSIEPGSATTPLPADHDSLNPIYEACLNANLPISISLSSTLSALAGHDMSWSSPIPMQRLAMKYPDLKIIASHAAWPWSEQMVAIAIMCPNIYVSPDIYIATQGMPASSAYIDAANLYLEDRTLFGTAYPSRPLKLGVDDFKKFPWRPEIVSKILYENAAKLFDL